MRGGLYSTSRSCQLDGAFDLKFEVDAAHGHDRLRRQTWAILQLSVRDGIAHRLLDLPLGGQRERLEKFTYSGVESFVVHDRSFVDTREALALPARNTCGTDCAKMCSCPDSKPPERIKTHAANPIRAGASTAGMGCLLIVIPFYSLRLRLSQISRLRSPSH